MDRKENLNNNNKKMQQIPELKKIKIEDYNLIKKYYMLRRPMTSDSVILNLYLWENCYETYYYYNEKGLFFVAKDEDGYYTSPPMCREEDIEECFFNVQDYFNSVLNTKMKMLLTDTKMLKILNLSDSEYETEPAEKYYDYIYDAESLRTLSGRKYHKKKNHYNSFVKKYEGRYEFKFLTGKDREEIIRYLDKWRNDKEGADEREYIDFEAVGIDYILKHYNELEYKIGGVYIDGVLEAFTIGCYYNEEKTAYIQVEKANANISGLYTYINKKFLTEAFPQAKYVNREDDMGVEGLKKAKESYKPIFMIEKYNIYQK